jgi:hypothetical protein
MTTRVHSSGELASSEFEYQVHREIVVGVQPVLSALGSSPNPLGNNVLGFCVDNGPTKKWLAARPPALSAPSLASQPFLSG